MELHEVIQRAQVALEQGDYLLAVAACNHALEAYPTCLSAHRALGEALLEQGEVDRAVEHFERTLRIDPLNLVARLGLGVAAEERNDPQTAYAHYTNAWDLNPALDQLRDELARLRMALGLDRRLHPTRAGLASIYLRGGQLGRAAAEWRAVLAAEPDGDRAPVALAEVLWRQSDDAGAAAACHEALRRTPENARALALLAEIEHRRQAPTAGETLERYQALDPGGDLAVLLSEARPAADLGFLLASAPIADFVFEPPALEVAAPVAPQPTKTNGGLPASHLPAPDLWDNIVRDLGGNTPGLDESALDALVVPFDWTEGVPLELEPVDSSYDPLAASLDAFDAVAPPVAEATWDEHLAPAPAWPSDPTAPGGAEAVATADTQGVSAHAVGGDNGFADVAAGLADVADAIVAAGNAAADDDPFITTDGRIDLTVGWDDLDRVLDEATPRRPTATPDVAFDDLMAEFDAGGIAPFTTDDATAEAGAWEPFDPAELADPDPTPLDDAVVAPPVAAEPAPALVDDGVVEEPAALDILLAEPPAPAAEVAAELEPAIAAEVDATFAPPPVAPAGRVPADPLATIAENWDRIDEELEAAIPTQQPSGYTDILRNIDQEGIIPFGMLDPDTDVDPLAPLDAVGQPLGFDDLMTVTSRDSTDHLSRAVAATVPEPAPVPAAPSVAAPVEPDIAAQLEPFAIDEVVQSTTAVPAADYFADLDFVPVPVVAAIEPILPVAPAAAPAELADPAPPERVEVPTTAYHASGEASGTNGSRHAALSWPTFVGGTSELIDRDSAVDGLFGRLRAERDNLVASHAVVIDLSLRSVSAAGWTAAAASAAFRAAAGGVLVPITTDDLMAPPPAREPAPELAPVAVAARATPATATVDPGDYGLNLVELRERLKQGRDEAEAVAAELESAIAAGRMGPLLARVLGEAYLKLGRGDQAAAQFRQAIALRGRRR